MKRYKDITYQRTKRGMFGDKITVTRKQLVNVMKKKKLNFGNKQAMKDLMKLPKNFGKMNKAGIKKAMEWGRKFEGLKHVMAEVCPHCYNKGYSTEFMGASFAMADFIGDETYQIKNPGIVIHFCICSRGKDLQKFFDLKKQFK